MAATATTVVNIRRSAYDVYIGRAGKGQDGRFGNPFRVQEHGRKALAMFEEWFRKRVADDVDFRIAVLGLEGKRLGCFCKTAKGAGDCHGDSYVRWIEEQQAAGLRHMAGVAGVRCAMTAERTMSARIEDVNCVPCLEIVSRRRKEAGR